MEDQEIERLRKSTLLMCGVAAVLGLIFVLAMLSFVPGFWIISFIGLFGVLIVCSKQVGTFRLKVKNQIVRAELASEFTDLHYAAEAGFSRNYIAGTELVSMGNRFHSNDMISGRYKDVAFRQADVHIQQHTQSGKTSSTVTLFKGRWLVYTFNKHFTGYLQVRSNENHLFGNGRPVRWFGSRPDTQKLKMENEEFNAAFNIYASDQEEAYYILTPHFMEKLLKLDQELTGVLIAGFIENELHIALYNNEDAFEPSLFTPVDDHYRNKIKADAQMIKTIIDDLALDVDIYK